MSDQEAALAVERHHDQWHSDSMAECSNPACTLYRAFGRQATALAEARRALAEYGRHQATCRDADYADTLAALVREGHDCECGWLRVPRGPDRGTR